MKPKHCYQLGEVWYFRKKIPSGKTEKGITYRVSLKKLLGSVYYSELLLNGFLYNFVSYLNDHVDRYIDAHEKVTVEELNEFVKSLLRRYKEKAIIKETSERDFIDNFGSDFSVVEEKRFKALQYYDDNGKLIGGHTPEALKREKLSLMNAFDTSKMSNVAEAAQRILQRQDIITSEEVEKIPERLLKPFFEAMIKIEIDAIGQDIKNYEFNTGFDGIESQNGGVFDKETVVNAFLEALQKQQKSNGMEPNLPEVSALNKATSQDTEDDWDSLIEEYIRYTRELNRSANTIRTKQIDLRTFKELMLGDPSLGIQERQLKTINHEGVMQIRKMLLLLPDLRQKAIEPYRGRGIHYLMKMNADEKSQIHFEKISFGGAKAKVKSIKGFLRFLNTTNPYYQKKINMDLWNFIQLDENSLSAEQKEEKEHDDKLPLYAEDLNKFYCDRYDDADTNALKNFKIHTKSSPHIFWGQILNLYTGARAEEIAQMKVSDFKKITVDGRTVYALSFKVTDKDMQRLKTKSSRRMIPLHPNVIRLCFFNYLKQRIESNKVWLFDLNVDKDGKRKQIRTNWNADFKKWFVQEHPDHIGRPATYHGLRSYFVSRFYQHQENDSRFSDANLKKFIGHEKKLNVTIDSYYIENIDVVLAYDILTTMDFRFDQGQQYLEKLVKKYIGEPVSNLNL